MSRLNPIIFVLLCCIALPYHAYAADDEAPSEAKLTLLIGIPENRAPFIFLNKKQVIDGILIKPINDLCRHIHYDCVFITGDYYPMLGRLQTGGLQVLVVIDDVILPDIDQIKLTQPLCDIKPVFVQLDDGSKPATKEPNSFEGKRLGVLAGSTMHLQLLDHYSEFASIRPYELMENGAFDLSFGRVDSLYTSEAFYLDKIKAQNLGSQISPQKKFTAVTMKKPASFPSGMRLAIPENETELLKKFDDAMTKENLGGSCSSLLEHNRKNLSIMINKPR